MSNDEGEPMDIGFQTRRSTTVSKAWSFITAHFCIHLLFIEEVSTVKFTCLSNETGTFSPVVHFTALLALQNKYYRRYNI